MEPESCRLQAEKAFQRALSLAGYVDEVAHDFRWRNAILAARQRLTRIAEGRGELHSARAAYVEIAHAYDQMSAAMPKHAASPVPSLSRWLCPKYLDS